MKCYELLDSPQKWTRYVTARDQENKPVTSLSEDACKWCATGAIRRCYDENNTARAMRKKLYDYLIRTHQMGPIASWNDNKNTSYEDVIEAFKELDI